MFMNHLDFWYDWPLILAYHSVSASRNDTIAVRPDAFEYQMDWLHRHHYRSLTLAQYMTELPEKGERIVIITFDDGYADNFTQAFPILQRYGFVATIFLVSDYVDTDRILRSDVSKISCKSDRTLYQLLTWEQVEEMVAHGCEVGSHTCTHAKLPSLSDELSMEEIQRSRIDLQNRLKHEIVSFCYPYGHLNTNLSRMVETAGYRCAVVTPHGAKLPLNAYTLRRIGVYYANTALHFRLKVTPFIRTRYEYAKHLMVTYRDRYSSE
jgi:peptidoglycan/xylan/chitin deacetylase (PgdA/CDA1 family)